MVCGSGWCGQTGGDACSDTGSGGCDAVCTGTDSCSGDSYCSGQEAEPAQAAAAKPQAPGGGKGLVWVNTSSNVYHCSDDPYYGRTKAGAYMTEDAAKAKGAHGDRGATCAGK